ncbi:hypothetical protein [Endozoicomonas sp. GU-1]|uniref:hypothetical protein n=1 Tax=Endozoicomonas sp. GU-1 TaxID=3009078 RepID=UPI0022B34D9D|nr:hypothetical protein [Endozoicomonas sp. GU-1]WBA79589.1 hypothetical protein O2T12_14490 [Endozoicomonas sp. GU-1]
MFEAYFKASSAGTVEDKEVLRRTIADEIAAFLKTGKKIQTFPLGMTSTNKTEFNTGIISNRKKRQ